MILYNNYNYLQTIKFYWSEENNRAKNFVMINKG